MKCFSVGVVKVMEMQKINMQYKCKFPGLYVEGGEFFSCCGRIVGTE